MSPPRKGVQCHPRQMMKLPLHRHSQIIHRRHQLLLRSRFQLFPPRSISKSGLEAQTGLPVSQAQSVHLATILTVPAMSPNHTAPHPASSSTVVPSQEDEQGVGNNDDDDDDDDVDDNSPPVPKRRKTLAKISNAKLPIRGVLESLERELQREELAKRQRASETHKQRLMRGPLKDGEGAFRVPKLPEATGWLREFHEQGKAVDAY